MLCAVISPRHPAGPREVATHYDALDRFYRELWGEHVHHGLWSTGRESAAEATVRLVDCVADLAGVAEGSRICDVGCGYGGTARRLTADRGAEVTGLTISAAQHAWATARDATGTGPRPRLLLLSWLDNGLEPASFDAVIAIESLSHMPDKPRAFAECARVLRPGGRLVLCDWLAGPRVNERGRRLLLEPICREGHLPSMHTAPEYRALAQDAGLRVLEQADWSGQVRRTWAICLARLAGILARDAEARRFLLSAQNPDRAFALSMARIPLAYAARVMRYGVLVAERPAG